MKNAFCGGDRIEPIREKDLPLQSGLPYQSASQNLKTRTLASV
ncbi:hypothetical protein QMN07_09160 [Leptospira santarosai]|nr:hypothetical protein [Leptospira santarosai]MDI7217688.1 hypothetical protein [Leptospira santarosai]